MDLLERHALALGQLDRDLLGRRAQDSHGDRAVLARMGAEHRMGLGMLATGQRLEL